mmetsp:Transcript_54009/g.101473  ORF Transcript_54009/g.101473 Transcript_54009/m.101473 type:complete len:434 (+) Transcript_54009:73-1374(+)
MVDEEEQGKKPRQLSVLLSNAKGVQNSSSLLTILLPGSSNVKEWEEKLRNRPQSRTSREGEYMQNISKASDHWPLFEMAAVEAQHRFRQIVQKNKGKLPKNGIVMFVGAADPRQNIDFEPHNAVQAPVHLCDAKYHVEYLSTLTCQHVYGFIIVDGNGCLCGTLSGHSKKVREKFSVDLPNKHGRGGQSALRFARLRLEKRHYYLQKVAELAKRCFISSESANISVLVLAGAAEFKDNLTSNCLLDPRLQDVLLATLDISYGGEHGFHQAIHLSKDILRDVEFQSERRVISAFLNEVSKDSGIYCYGMQETITALEMGAVDTLIVWDQFPEKLFVARSPATDTEEVLLVNPALLDEHHDPDTQVVEIQFVDWIIDKHKAFGTKLEFITDQSTEGTQFCKGFGGIGGVLRYKTEFEVEQEMSDSDSVDSDSDFE